MNTESQQLLRFALELPESDRAEIAALRIDSLDKQSNEDANVAWAKEIQRRVDSIDCGDAKLVPWDDVMYEMAERRNG